MYPARFANFRSPNLAAVFLLVIGLLISSVALTYWLAIQANASNRKLADLPRGYRAFGPTARQRDGSRNWAKRVLLVGRESYLGLYHAALSAVQNELAAIDELVARGELPDEAVAQDQVAGESEVVGTETDYLGIPRPRS